MRRIKYYLFCINWLYKNRRWYDTRQKFKAMNREYKERVRKNERKKELPVLNRN